MTLHETLKAKERNKKMTISAIIGFAVLLVVVFAASFAYFSVTAQNNATTSDVQGSAKSKGDALLTTNTANLYSNLNWVMMNQENIGTIYYATTDVENKAPIVGTTENPIALGRGIYTLATASITGGETIFDCNYKFNLTAGLTNAINDGSDEDIKVKIEGSSITNGYVEYTLKEIIAAGSTGIEISGTFANLTPGVDQTLTIQSTIENTAASQNDFAGNSYQITVAPVSDPDGFACEIVG